MTSQVMEWEPAEWKFDDEGNGSVELCEIVT